MGKGISRPKVVRATVLATAVMVAYGPTQAAETNHIIYSDGNNHTLSGEHQDTVVELNNGSGITGSKVQLAGPGDDYDGGDFAIEAMVAVSEASSFSLTDSTISGTVPRNNFRLVSALGEGSTLSLTNTHLESHTGGAGSNSTAAVMVRDGAAGDISGGSITTTGDNNRGLVATDNGHITAEGVAISTSGSSSHAVALDAAAGDTTLDINNSHISATGGYRAAGIQVSVADGATGTVTGTGNTIDSATSAVLVEGEGARLALSDSSITTSGSVDNRGSVTHGVNATNGATVELAGGSVNTTGENFTTGIFAAGSSQVSGDGVQIATRGDTGVGVRAYSYSENEGDPSDTPSVTLTGGSIDTQGVESYGAWAQDVGARVSLTGTGISTRGENAHGVVASNAGLAQLTNAQVNTQGAGAAGVSLNGIGERYRPGNGLEPAFGGELRMDGGAIQTTGANAHGISARKNSRAQVQNAIINTTGAEAHGVMLASGSTAQISGTQISASGTGASGVLLQDDSSVTLNDVAVSSGGSTIRSQLTQAGQTQDITVGSGSNLTDNDGTLLQVNRDEAGMDGTVNLTLQGGSVARGDISDLDGLADGSRPQGGSTNFVLEAGAQWSGRVLGVDEIEVGDGGSFVDNGGEPINGSLIAGSDSTIVFNNGATITENVETQSGSTATFNGPTSIGGDVRGTGSQFTFSDATSIGGSVYGSETSFAFSQTAPTTLAGDLMLESGSQVQGGTRAAPVTIEGDATVASGSTLGGNLDIQGNLDASDSTIAPGNSVGTITTQTVGSLSGTRFDVEVDAAGDADLLVVRSGDVDLSGASLRVDRENGSGGYKLGHDYLIIQAQDGQVRNTFDEAELGESLDGALVKLDPVDYGPNDVKVSLSIDEDAAADRSGYTANQSATLDGALSVAGNNASADAVMFMQPDARKDALNQLSGELHGSTQAALLQSSSLVSRTLTQRLRANLGAGMLPGAPTAQAGGAVAGALPTSAAYPLWAQVVGNWNTLDSDGNAAKVKTDTAGLFIGGDTEVGAGWRVGGALGYTDGRVKVDERDSKSDISTFTAALYGGNSWKQDRGTLNFLAGAAYSHHDIDSRRTVNVGGNQTLKADYRAHTTQLFTELGYAVPVGSLSVVEPYLGLAWLSQKAKGFTEEGGPAALQGESQKDDVTTFTLGLRGKTALEVGAHQAHVFAGLGWRHASGDVDPGRRVSFVQGGGAAFNVAGAPIAKNAAVLDLGVEMAVGRNTAMGLGYSGQYGSDNTDHSGQLYLRTRF